MHSTMYACPQCLACPHSMYNVVRTAYSTYIIQDSTCSSHWSPQKQATAVTGPVLAAAEIKDMFIYWPVLLP